MTIKALATKAVEGVVFVTIGLPVGFIKAIIDQRAIVRETDEFLRLQKWRNGSEG